MSNKFGRINKGLRSITEHPLLAKLGRWFVVIGCGLVLLVGISFLLPFIGQFLPSATQSAVAPPAALHLCVPTAWKTTLQPLLDSWNNTSKKTFLTYFWELRSPGESASDCQAEISSESRPSSQPWYSFPLILVLPRAEAAHISAAQWQQALTAKRIINATSWPVGDLSPAPDPSTTRLSQEGKWLVTTPAQLLTVSATVQPAVIDGKTFTEKEYPVRVELFWTSWQNSTEVKALRDYLLMELINRQSTGAVQTIVLSGPQQLGARGQFGQQPKLSAAQKNALKSSNALFMANQTTLTDRCSQHADSTYLCGQPTSLASYQPALQAVFQYGNSSFDYDYNDFVAMLARYRQQHVAVVGANSSSTLATSRVTTGGLTFTVVGFNLGVKGELCTGATTSLPAGLQCAHNLTEVPKQLATIHSTTPVIVWLYQPTAWSPRDLKSLWSEQNVVAVIALSNGQSKTTWQWGQAHAGSQVLLLPRWRFDQESPDLFELQFLNGQLLDGKQI